MENWKNQATGYLSIPPLILRTGTLQQVSLAKFVSGHSR
jgi:hypothetical protein